MKIFDKLKETNQPAVAKRRQASSSTSEVRHRRQAGSGSSKEFRRNYTIVGSASSDIDASGVALGVGLDSPRTKAHKLRHKRVRLAKYLGLALLGAGLLAGVIYQFIVTPEVKLVGIGNSKSRVSQEVYAEGVQRYLNDHFFERNQLALNVDNLVGYMQANGYPEVEAVSDDIHHSGVGRAVFMIKLRRPTVMWEMGDETLYVDSAGNAFRHNAYPDPSVRVIDDTGIEAMGSRVLVSDRFLSFIGKTVGWYAREGYDASQVVLPADTSRQILVHVDGVSYPVKLTVDRPAGGQVEDSVRSIKHLAKEGIAPKQYLDVRVSGKAFYK